MIKNRIELAKYFNKKGFRVGAEIGVADGRYSEILCQEIPGLKLYAIDLWAPYKDCWRTQKTQDVAYDQAVEKLSKYDVEIWREKSIESSLKIEDGSLDFVFIDGGHTFDDVMLDILLWTDKVKKGGIVALHDYMFFTDSGIVESVDKYCQIHKIEKVVVPRNKYQHRDDRQPIVYWVKK